MSVSSSPPAVYGGTLARVRWFVNPQLDIALAPVLGWFSIWRRGYCSSESTLATNAVMSGGPVKVVHARLANTQRRVRSAERIIGTTAVQLPTGAGVRADGL